MRFADAFLGLPASGGESGPVPVLYYLAGLTCTEETFAIKAGAQRVAAELGLMLVAPDTSPRIPRLPGDDSAWDFGLGAGFYVDATQRTLVAPLPHVLLRDARTAGDRGRELSGQGRRPGHFRSLDGRSRRAGLRAAQSRQLPVAVRVRADRRTVTLPVGHEGIQRVPGRRSQGMGGVRRQRADRSSGLSRAGYSSTRDRRTRSCASNCCRTRSRPRRARPDRISNCAGTRAMTTGTSSSRASSRTTCGTTPPHCTRPDQPQRRRDAAPGYWTIWFSSPLR